MAKMKMEFDAFDVVAVVFSIFSVLTTPLYISLILLLFKERKRAFKGSFFRYFSAVGLLDITSSLNNFFGVSLPGWGITTAIAQEYEFLYARIYLFLAWFTRTNQGTSSLLIAVNRAYALMFPMKFAMISPEVNWLHLFQIIPGLIVGGVAVSFPCQYEIHANRTLRRATPKIYSDTGKQWLYLGGATVEILQIIVIIICYCFSSHRLLCRRNAVGKKKQSGNSVEKSATALGMCICTFELIYFAYMVTTQLAHMPSWKYFSIHSTVTDFYSCVNCYLILSFSSSVRRRMWSHITCSHRTDLISLQGKKSTASTRME